MVPITVPEIIQMDETILDKLAVRDCIESWAIWRDSGDFDRLRTCFHHDGRMTAAWFQGTADQFVAGARASFAKGNMSRHELGATSIDLVSTITHIDAASATSFDGRGRHAYLAPCHPMVPPCSRPSRPSFRRPKGAGLDCHSTRRRVCGSRKGSR